MVQALFWNLSSFRSPVKNLIHSRHWRGCNFLFFSTWTTRFQVKGISVFNKSIVNSCFSNYSKFVNAAMTKRKSKVPYILEQELTSKSQLYDTSSDNKCYGENVEYEINTHIWVTMCLYTCAHVHAWIHSHTHYMLSPRSYQKYILTLICNELQKVETDQHRNLYSLWDSKQTVTQCLT